MLGLKVETQLARITTTAMMTVSAHEGMDPSQEPKSMEERKAKMDELRQKMASSHISPCLSHLFKVIHQRISSIANRASLIEENTKAKLSAREAARLDKQRKLAEVLRAKADAEERGEDVEREKNWEWTIEENDYWEKKKARKARRADFEFHGEFFSYLIGLGLTSRR